MKFKRMDVFPFYFIHNEHRKLYDQDIEIFQTFHQIVHFEQYKYWKIISILIKELQLKKHLRNHNDFVGILYGQCISKVPKNKDSFRMFQSHNKKELYKCLIDGFQLNVHEFNELIRFDFEYLDIDTLDYLHHARYKLILNKFIQKHIQKLKHKQCMDELIEWSYRPGSGTRFKEAQSDFKLKTKMY